MWILTRPAADGPANYVQWRPGSTGVSEKLDSSNQPRHTQGQEKGDPQHLKGSALPADPKIQKTKNEKLQKLIILEGFMQTWISKSNSAYFFIVGLHVSKSSFDIC